VSPKKAISDPEMRAERNKRKMMEIK